MEQDGTAARLGLASRIDELRGVDNSHTCQIRLLSLRARIEGNWPGGRSLFRRGKGMAQASEATIEDLLVALPTPLPLHAGAEPQSIFCDSDSELLQVAGRAVDAGLALLDGFSLDATYPGDVTILESRRPGALEPIVMSNPTVGLLVATIIGTLEAISEAVSGPAPKPDRAGRKEPPADGDTNTLGSKGRDAGGPNKPATRGNGVPRI